MDFSLGTKTKTNNKTKQQKRKTNKQSKQSEKFITHMQTHAPKISNSLFFF